MERIKTLVLLVFLMIASSLATAKEDINLTKEAKLLKQLFDREKFAECIKKSEQFRRSAEKQHYSGAELYSIALIANCHYHLFNYNKALFYGLLAENKFENPNDSLQTEGFFLAAYMLADIYYKIGKLPSAYKRYWKIYYYSDLKKGILTHTQIYNTIGILLFKQNKYTKAKEFFLKALASLNSKNENLFNIHYKKQEIYDNIGLTYYKIQDYPVAMAYYDSALFEIKNLVPDAPEKIKLPKIAKAVVLGNIAKLLIKENNFEKAKQYCKENITINLGVSGIKEEAVRSLLDIADAYIETDSLEIAKQYIEDAKIYINKFSFHEVNSAYMNVSYKYEKKKGNIKNALLFLENYNKLQDSLRIIFVDNNFYQNLSENELTEAQTQLKYFKNKELLEKSSQQKSLYIMILGIVLLVIVFMILLIYYRSYIKEKKLKEELFLSNSELKKTNSDLNYSIAEKNDILGFVAHDLRGPLASNIGLQKMLFEKLKNVSKDPDVPAIFNYLKLSNTYLTEVTDDLVEATYLERRDLKLDLSQENLLEIFDDIIEICKPEVISKNLKIFVQHPDSEVIVNLNKDKFKRAILNILSNAMKFTPEEGSVFCTISVVDNVALIIIKDTGVGITEENLKIVFDKFSKASRKGVRGEKSNGLGLYIVAKIIEIHGGEISIKSQEMEGTEISISLPLAT